MHFEWGGFVLSMNIELHMVPRKHFCSLNLNKKAKIEGKIQFLSMSRSDFHIIASAPCSTSEIASVSISNGKSSLWFGFSVKTIASEKLYVTLIGTGGFWIVFELKKKIFN